MLTTLDMELCLDRDALVPLSAVRNSETLLVDVLTPEARRPPAAVPDGGRSPRVVRTVNVLAADPDRGVCALVPVRDEVAERGRGAGETLTLTAGRALLPFPGGVVVVVNVAGVDEPGSARVGTGGFFSASRYI